MSAYIASIQEERRISSKVASIQVPPTITRRRKKTILLICSLPILIALVTATLLVIRPAIVGSQPQQVESLSLVPSSAPSTLMDVEIRTKIQHISAYDSAALDDPSSPQSKALDWILQSIPYDTDDDDGPASFVTILPNG